VDDGALAEEGFGDLEADTAGAGGDENAQALKAEIHECPPCSTWMR
jgi:hypothetical protein